MGIFLCSQAQRNPKITNLPPLGCPTHTRIENFGQFREVWKIVTSIDHSGPGLPKKKTDPAGDPQKIWLYVAFCISKLVLLKHTLFGAQNWKLPDSWNHTLNRSTTISNREFIHFLIISFQKELQTWLAFLRFPPWKNRWHVVAM